MKEERPVPVYLTKKQWRQIVRSLENDMASQYVPYSEFREIIDNIDKVIGTDEK